MVTAMPLSKDRILTTHVGSLPRPQGLLDLMLAKADGKSFDAVSLANKIGIAVRNVVAKQVEVGIDIVSDGEMSKPSYATYVTERLDGFGGETIGHRAYDLTDYKDYARRLVEVGGVIPSMTGPCCEGPVGVKDEEPLRNDLANFDAAVRAEHPKAAFMNAASPGVVSLFQRNKFYDTEDEYLEAIANVLRAEYEAIVDAGFVVQIDSPDLAMGRHMAYADKSDMEFRDVVVRHVEVLNAATANIAPEAMRLHVCWGNYEGPHHRDIPLEAIVDLVLKARPAAISLEGANPRHEHEWHVFQSVDLPDDKVLMPGVIDSTSNYIEHSEVVAQRICRYADVVGRERVIASSDCGFSTFSGYPTVYPDITWAKLGSLVEGAQLASTRLW
jgi:5-methyltetrahydropteroyltriglutamate--homocysteine methyltransferase